jgi:4-aminobutyrate aminotransferase-like enzyme
VLERDDLAARAARLGTRLRQRLDALVGRGGLRQVRGLGLLIGLEFDHPAACARAAERAWAERLILNWTLHRDTVIRLAPPLVLTDAEADEALRRLAAVLA